MVMAVLPGTVWIFYDYLDRRGGNPVRGWLDSQPMAVRAKFDAVIRHLRVMDPGAWRRPTVDMLAGECSGLREIRVTRQRVQYRLIACVEGHMVILLAGAHERGGKLVPASTCRTAQERRGDALNDDLRRCHHQFG